MPSAVASTSAAAAATSAARGDEGALRSLVGAGVAQGQGGLSSGFAALDAQLPWHGWPCGAMTELFVDGCGRGELSLLLPALARCSAQGGRIVVVAPPHGLYGPALQQAGIDAACVQQVLCAAPEAGAARRGKGRRAPDALWAAEQWLRGGAVAALLLWSRQCPADALRRLQLAVLGQPTAFFHFRPPECAANPSPAWLRIALDSDHRELRLRWVKCRGRWLARPLLTLDRAEVQAPVYRQWRGNAHLDHLVRHGIDPAAAAQVAMRDREGGRASRVVSAERPQAPETVATAQLASDDAMTEP